MRIAPRLFVFALLACGGLATSSSAQSTTRGYIPRHQRAPAMRAPAPRRVFVQEGPMEAAPPDALPAPMPQGEEIYPREPSTVWEDIPGETVWEGDVVGDGYFQDSHLGPPIGGCADGCFDGSCGVGLHGWAGGCGHGCPLVCPWALLAQIDYSVGKQGFTGPTNRGGAGSFGFYESLNWAGPLNLLTCNNLGGQVGVRATQSNLSGASFFRDQRNQVFMTAGLFRRVDYGLQGGVVVDWLHDAWYAKYDVVQLRGELSWVYPAHHEIGFWFSAGTREKMAITVLDNQNSMFETFRPTDLYAFFYRKQVNCRGEGRFYAGFTGESDGFLGADLKIALSPRWSLDTTFSYLVPKQSTATTGFAEESWNVALGMTWYPGIRQAIANDYFRPLFDVAHNGNFMVDRF